jgi:chitinase
LEKPAIMNFNRYLWLILLSLNCSVHAQSPVLIGYWQNWNDSNAPYIPLDQVDSRYDVICVSFAVPTSPSDMHMLFIPDVVSQATLISQIQTLQSQGKKVLISIGGATTGISLNDITNRDAFITTMMSMLNTYHFDGIDIDIEHGDSVLAAGTINSPTNFDAINFMYALSQIRTNYFNLFGQNMMLTFAPETAYVQGGMSAFGGIWGGYLPIIDYFRNELDYVHVQLYNSGSMYGIDGTIYTQGTADFIVAMTEAVIQGFDTAGGHFDGLPANKVAIGLPACPSAAGGGFASAATVASAVNYLRGNGTQPGSYTLVQSGGYPNLAGMMDWSINWDKVTTCNATTYEYATNFESLFPTLSNPEFGLELFSIAPNPVKDNIIIHGNVEGDFQIANLQGQIVAKGKIGNQSIPAAHLAKGLYFIRTEKGIVKFVKE